MYAIESQYKGIVPMMMDRFYEASDVESGGKRKAKKLNPAELRRHLELKLHMDINGIYVPSDNLRMMLIGNQLRRGAATILGSEIEKGKGTMYRSLCTGCIWVMGIDNPLKCYIEPSRKTYDSYDERAIPTVKGKGVSRVITRRPLIELPWSVRFIIQVTDDGIDQSFVRQLFDLAGLRCGICAYGPTFGRCLIDFWQIKSVGNETESQKEKQKGE